MQVSKPWMTQRLSCRDAAFRIDLQQRAHQILGCRRTMTNQVFES